MCPCTNVWVSLTTSLFASRRKWPSSVPCLASASKVDAKQRWVIDSTSHSIVRDDMSHNTEYRSTLSWSIANHRSLPAHHVACREHSSTCRAVQSNAWLTSSTHAITSLGTQLDNLVTSTSTTKTTLNYHIHSQHPVTTLGVVAQPQQMNI